MASSEEALKAENARLVADMASMKKKIMVALKKQQAELQAKVQAAEERALAAEAAAAAVNSAMANKVVDANGQNGCLPNTNGSIREQIGVASPDRALSPGLDAHTAESSIGTVSPESSFTEVSSHGGVEITEDDHSQSRKRLWSEIEMLKSELEEERHRRKNEEDAALMEKQRLLLEIKDLKATVDDQARQRDQVKENLESEIRRLKGDAAEQIELLKKANEKLENQLLAAAEQVSEAFARIASTHDEMERVSKGANESRHAHANLLKEHERACEELEQVRAALLQAQKDAEDKSKEMEEMAAVRKAAQEGQDAAMSQLMQHLHEMDTTVVGQTTEQMGKVSLESLLKERAVLAKQLQERTTALSQLQKHAADLQGRLASLEENKVDKLEASEEKSLATIVSELQIQNELLTTQLQGFQSQAGTMEDVDKEIQHDKQEPLCESELLKELADLRKQLQESGSSQLTGEQLVKQLQTSVVDAEQRAEHLTQELIEVQRKMDEEIKARDEKYMELDAKFVKLQKRAKQRIQELQKEKEDVEAQLVATTEKASQATSQCGSLQHDLERVRAQAGEALRSLDGERQQLRNSNNRQKELIEEMRRTMETKEREHEEAQRLASEKDQMVHELTDKLMETEAKHEAVVGDLVTKHRKFVEDIESQLADVVQERNKAAETICSLQVQLAKKESQIAELDAASTGEAVRLGASLEAVRGELSRIEQEHKKEQEMWEATVDTLKVKLEESEKTYLQQKIAAAKARSQLESELEGERQALSVAQAELAASREQAARLEKEFAAYKVRAYSLLQKKEAELSAAKDAEQLATQEAALKEAQRLASSTAAERDRALKSLQDAIVKHDSQLAARSVALLDAEQKIRELATKLEATKTQILSEQEAWQSRVDEVDAAWRVKYETLEGKIRDASNGDLNKELVSLKKDYAHLKGEYESFQEMANSMVESKDQEISHLLDDIREMQKTIANQSKATSDVVKKTAIEQEDVSTSSIAIAEHQILLLARQQAQREEELAQCRRHIQALQEEIVELEHENRLHTQQESVLKEELRNSERSQRREGVDMTYLKNVILKLLETGEVEALLPVIAMLLQFSPEELRKCQEAYNAVPDVPAAVVDAASSAPRTLLSRFTFSNTGR